MRLLEDAGQHNREKDIRWIMSDPRGRRVFAGLIHQHLEKDGVCFDDAGRADAYASAFDSGMMQFAVDINQELRAACPDEWLLMQAEAMQTEEMDE